ncbi:MAG: EamA family transporter [Actinomycetota bacterium]|nr:EamA family transporter [Actinomycetota bacterium]MDA8076676.1 EamA family transporter [Actinomycetota bacterium]
MGIIVALGLSAAIVYGSSDFLGGFASQRMTSLEVTFVAFAVGTLTCVALLPLAGSHWSLAVLGYGALAGVTAAGSIWLLYSALAMGPVSVLAPTVAVIAGLVPVLYGLSHGERLGPPGEGAIGVVLFSAALLAHDPKGHGGRVRPKALGIGLAAGVVTGLFLVSLDLTPTNSGAAPVLVEFAVGAGLLGVGVLFRHLVSSPTSYCDESPTAPRSPLRFAIASGVTQATADVLVILGIHRGHLAVMAALMALYPLGTLACARVVLHERLSRVQAIAVIMAVAASAVLASIGTG